MTGSIPRDARRLPVFALLLAALLCPSGRPAADTANTDGSWSGLFWPSARYGHAVVHDPVRDRMIVVGGHDGTQRLNDVWILSLSARPPMWTRLMHHMSGGPSGRYAHTAVYDAAGDRLILFGGDDGDIVNDVWELPFTGTPAWSRLAPSGSPPPARYRHSAIYDPVGKQMIVFGGKRDSTLHADAWALSLSGTPEWRQLIPQGSGPSARYRHSAVYDAIRERMIVFGGDDGRKRRDVWALDLASMLSWSELSPAGAPPSARKSHAAFYDGANDCMTVFGGSDVLQDDTYTLGLGGTPAWSRLEPAGSPPRGHWSHGAVHDAGRGRLVVFGGETDDGSLSDETSILSLTGNPSWSRIEKPGFGYGRAWHSAIYDPVGERMVVFGGTDLQSGPSTTLDNTWALSLSGSPVWAPLATSPPPAPRFGHCAMYDPIRERMIVYGGYGGSYPNLDTQYDELWQLSLSVTPTWSRLQGSAMPFRREANLSAVHDRLRDRMIVIEAGYHNWIVVRAFSFATDHWRGLSTNGTPLEHIYSSAIYDPVRDRVLVFGGYMTAGFGYLTNDVWALSLATLDWTQINPAGTHPSPRYRHSAIYDPVRDRMVVFGGQAYAGDMNDVWELSLSGMPTWRRLEPAGPLPRAVQHHSAILDPVEDRMVVFAGRPGSFSINETWMLDWATPVTPSCDCPGDVTAPAADVRYVVANPIVGDRAIEWTLASARPWAGFPKRGVTVAGALESDTVALQIDVPDTATAGNRLTFTASYAGAAGNDVVCEHAISDVLTSTLASLVSAEATPGRARLAWRVNAPGPVTLYRRESSTPWEALATLSTTGEDLAYEDRTVETGKRYGYRLGWSGGSGETFAGEVWVDIPGAFELALHGVRPNPASENMVVAFTLPAAGRARLELFDVTGRLVRRQEWNGSPGHHVLPVPSSAALAPGVYIVHLEFAGRRSTARAVVTR